MCRQCSFLVISYDLPSSTEQWTLARMVFQETEIRTLREADEAHYWVDGLRFFLLRKSWIRIYLPWVGSGHRWQGESPHPLDPRMQQHSLWVMFFPGRGWLHCPLSKCSKHRCSLTSAWVQEDTVPLYGHIIAGAAGTAIPAGVVLIPITNFAMRSPNRHRIPTRLDDGLNGLWERSSLQCKGK